MDPKLTEVATDKRGSIFLVDNLLDGGREFTFMEMKKGSARGGCYHKNDEFFVVIKGKVKYICGDEEFELSEGDSGRIPAFKPHAFNALEDSIVSEWGITTKEKKEDIKDSALRGRVDELNGNL